MNRTLFLSAALLLSSTCAFAQPMHEHREEGQDRRELRKDRREIREDFHDLKTLEALRADFDAARARHDMGALKAIDNRLREQVRNELADDVGDLRRDRAEMHRDRRELRGDERRLERDREEGRVMAAEAEHHELHQDRRELREDARDAAARRAYLERHREVLNRLERLGDRLDHEALDRKRSAIDELIDIARSELHQDKHKIREDRRELREDERDEHHHH